MEGLLFPSTVGITHLEVPVVEWVQQGQEGGVEVSAESRCS